MALTVVGGGRRSGKSRYALALASAHGPRLGFVATLRGDDAESAQAITTARRERGAAFITTEEPLRLVEALAEMSADFDSIVVDDLTTWVSNLVMAGRTDAEIEAEAARLVELALRGLTALVVVTSDVDFGFAVDTDASRAFRRLAGLINRRMAESAARLYWMVFGIPNRVR